MSRRQCRSSVAASLLALLLAAVVLPTRLASAAENDTTQKLPRFVSLRSDQVNLRVGPGENYPIEWVLTRKDMPVELVRRFENWRMIRDWQGTEGWVHERMVADRRGIIVKGGIRALHRDPDPAAQIVARAEPGVVGRLLECRGGWCRVEAAEFTGWVQRSEIWGVYPEEVVP